MPIPFASGYAPINVLNNAIQAQATGQDRGYLDAARINQQEIADSLNRIVQQKALQQQAEAQRQHYGLQQQQLANDLAYRNQALGLTQQQQAEAKRQFDAKLELDRAIANANIRAMDRPGAGMGKDFGLGALQSMQDVASHNAAATAVASQASGALAAARAAYKAEVAQINDPNLGEAFWRHVPGTQTKQDLLNSAKAKFDLTYNKLLADLGPHRDKVSLVGSPEENGTFQPVLLQAPQMPGFNTAITAQSQSPGDGSEPSSSGAANVGAVDVNSPENQPMANFQPAPIAAPRFNAFGVPTSINPFTWFGGGARTNAPPVLARPPATTVTSIAPVSSAQAINGVHYRTNPDGTMTVLAPIIDPNGQIVRPGSTLQPMQ